MPVPHMSAASVGEHPMLSRVCRAPASTSALTTFEFPFFIATCSGVSPLGAATFGSHSLSSSHTTASAAALATAVCSTDSPAGLEPKFTPAAVMLCKTSGWSVAMARWSTATAGAVSTMTHRCARATTVSPSSSTLLNMSAVRPSSKHSAQITPQYREDTAARSAARSAACSALPPDLRPKNWGKPTSARWSRRHLTISVFPDSAARDKLLVGALSSWVAM
mmetsp:Transcript_51921/g.137310  ORF Transcript_51921/g.137310 Transcript_51921/m.137310 type:complete len:221 (-) Transcript_51921:2171-2833(-)